MHAASRLFSDSIEGTRAGACTKATAGASYHPNHELLTYLSVREEELWAGTGSCLLLG
jgi:hypothetical protein